MKFIIEKKILLKSLQRISILLGKNIDLPIINNILINVKKGFLFLTSTNLEIEIVTKIILSTPYIIGKITIPGRKFLNICRLLPSETDIHVFLEKNKIILKSNKIFFSLCTLSSENFPKFPKIINSSKNNFLIQEKILKYILASTYFCMAKQDVRAYLNGMLFEINDNVIRTVTTDGYRLAICNILLKENRSNFSIIISRQGIIELIKILNYSNDNIKILINQQNISFQKQDFKFTTRLIDGQFPNYTNILLSNKKKIIEINTKLLRDSISRIAILCNQQFRAISFLISNNQLKISANNQIDELAEEIVHLSYQNNLEKIEFSFNVNYILDVLNVIQGKDVRFILNIPISSIQIEDTIKTFSKYVIMPIQM